MSSTPVRVPFYSDEGDPVAELELFAEADETGPFIISSEEASENGEAQIQLLEAAAYEYRVKASGFGLREEPGLVRSSRARSDYDLGRITPGLNVGRIRLALLSVSDGKITGFADLEVRSAKIAFRDEYRQMLNYIADRCADLLLEFRSPAEQPVLPEDAREPETICQRFAFVRSLITSRQFRDAVQRLIALPHRLWGQEEVDIPPGCGVKPCASVGRQIASATRRVALPSECQLSKRFRTIPERIIAVRNVETVDTPENRFVKHALRTFQAFASRVRELLEQSGRESDVRFIEEAVALEEELGELLSRDFFRAVSNPEILPLGSPVLHRKGGYREVLDAWLRFDMAARLSWAGGDEVYGAGKRNVATLYEYWVFFRLLEIVADIFHLDHPPAKSLIELTADGFGLKLKSGQYIPLEGDYVEESGGRRLRVRYSYNRTFPRRGSDPEKNYPTQGSWTERMRPDFTLSLWPIDFTESEAEKQELIVHVHFDAKYRVKDIPEMFGEPDEAFSDDESLEKDLTTDKAAQKEGRYRRGDLLKMHAYRDAIRRTVGAYVLYPGTKNRSWRGYHEIVPGLGAFAIRPTAAGDDGTAALKDFISQVVKHVCNRASQRDHESYHRYEVHKVEAGIQVVKEMPERYGKRLQRHAPAADTFVIRGFMDSAASEVCREKAVFYFHAVDNLGQAVIFDPGVLKADYLVPFVEGEKWAGWYARIARRQLVKRDELLTYVPAEIVGEQYPYYYVVFLKPDTISDFESVPENPPPLPGPPRLCRWIDLYTPSAKRK